MLLPKGKRATHQGKKYLPGDEIPEVVAKILGIHTTKQAPKQTPKTEK